MAGAFRRWASYLGLVEDDLSDGDDASFADDEDPFADEEAYEPASERHARSGRAEALPAARRGGLPAEPAAGTGGYRGSRQPPLQTVGANALAERPLPRERIRAVPSHVVNRIMTLHPRAYNDARAIGEEFRSGVPVILNLTDLDDSDAKRIIDFSAGLVFGLHGTIERVTSKVFLLSPECVDVGEQVRVQLSGAGFFNQS